MVNTEHSAFDIERDTAIVCSFIFHVLSFVSSNSICTVRNARGFFLWPETEDVYWTMFVIESHEIVHESYTGGCNFGDYR